MNVRTVPNQKWRSLFLFIYLAALIGVSHYIFGDWFPSPSGGKAVWFYTCLASLLLGNHLVTPYFSKPVDAISYAFAAIAAMVGAESLVSWEISEKTVFYAVIGYSVFVLIAAFVAIFSRSISGATATRISETGTILAGALGNHRAIFGLAMIAAAYLFHRDSLKETFFICIACLVFVVARPEEVLSGVLIRLRKVWSGVSSPSFFGEIASQQVPRIYLIRKNNDSYPKFATVLGIKIPGRKAAPAIVLDVVGRDDSTLVRVLELTEIANNDEYANPNSYGSIPENGVIDISGDSSWGGALHNIQAEYKSEFIGLVAPETSSEKLYIEVISARNLHEGMLLSVDVQGNKVIYQLLDGLTKEEVVHQKNTMGFVRAQAKKVGVWDVENKKFRTSKWLPNPNSPVFCVSQAVETASVDTIGFFPGASYPVQLKDLSALVTHNTAILGILGVGKSMLAIELVERMMANGIKVICLDLTDQYEIELGEFIDLQTEAQELDALYSFGSSGKTKYNSTIEDGGSVKSFRKELHRVISDFLNSADKKLKILNPARFDVWRQSSNQFKPADIPGMAQLTACQITQIISEVTLECAQNLGMTSVARICLVYEEAHSLVPEWNSVAFDGDKTATAGTSRAILQGRKYGMGCLLITQRTANVTKTILNQCNTIFAMRTFDDTGKDFLSNYVGRDYADMLSSLPERQAVFFGKASSCDNPVLIELNNRNDFKNIFRAKFPLPVIENNAPPEITADVAAVDFTL